ncbi:MAG TPA: hypothetical protein ENI62_08990 [Gammaproteobacteria bacterium]|nr:hypothetical protein [Gammaproteobacteria bacterium]
MRNLFWLLTFLLTACTSADSTSFTSNISGIWSGVIDGFISSTNKTHHVSFTANTVHDTKADTVTGTAAIPSEGDACFVGGPITGTVTGSKIEMQIADETGAKISLTGDLTSSTMVGIFSSNGGNCGAMSGSWRLSR